MTGIIRSEEGYKVLDKDIISFISIPLFFEIDYYQENANKIAIQDLSTYAKSEILENCPNLIIKNPNDPIFIRCRASSLSLYEVLGLPITALYRSSLDQFLKLICIGNTDVEKLGYCNLQLQTSRYQRCTRFKNN